MSFIEDDWHTKSCNYIRDNTISDSFVVMFWRYSVFVTK